MPALVRLYIRHCIIGFGIAAAFVGGVLYFNVANLWHLVTHTNEGPLALIVFWVLAGIVFAGVQFGVALMLMAEDPDKKAGGTSVRLSSAKQARPVLIPVEERRH